MQKETLIEEQINNCQELLKVFKEERENFSDNNSIDLNSVMNSLKRKQQILQSFEVQKEIMKNIGNDAESEKNEKKLLRELSRLLEQLLVIDQENEVMMRDLLTQTPAKAAKRQGSEASFRPRLPFCPGQDRPLNTSPSLSKSAPSKPSESAPVADNSNLFSRNRLKAYGI